VCTFWIRPAHRSATSSRCSLPPVDGEGVDARAETSFIDWDSQGAGWPAERERADGARAAFADLPPLLTGEAAVPAFLLEHDVVSVSPLIDDRADARQVEPALNMLFDYEARRGRASSVRESAGSGRLANPGKKPRPRSEDSRGHHPDAYSLAA
jgi:hypothetical protein